ncbi:hypothetical protein [Genomoviridae sp.]|nr:hypothetical protein [Genomoviridae sp.]
MFSSPTLNAARSLSGTFSTISRLLEVSVSLDEKITLMEVLTSMFSSILEGRSSPDDPIFLMSEATTRTLCHLEVVRKAVGTMRQKTETLLQGGWQGRAQIDFLQLRISGALSSMRKVEKSFLTSYANWIQRHLFSDTESCWNTPTDTSPNGSNPMWVPLGSNLSLEWYLSWLDGEESLLQMIQ